MTLAIVSLLLAVGILVWLWRGDREPLLPLVPFVLAFVPLLAFAGRALGWAGGGLSTREALLGCAVLYMLFRLLRRDYAYYAIPGIGFFAPYLLLVVLSVVWS